MNLYQKYRPQDFDEMIGNKDIIENLNKIINQENKPHTYLFTGPPGTGKTTAARICSKKLEGNELSIIEINSSNNRGIDTARQIIEQIRTLPIDGKVWVYIIDEVHKCTSEYQNAMLKSLEDTPDYVYFFLCTTDPQKLLPALKSRCTEYKFPNLKDKYLQRLIKRIVRRENKTITDNVVDKIIEYSNGSARTALVLLEKVIDENEEQSLIILKERKDESAQVINLCRVLLNNRSDWNQITGILKLLKGEEVENIRYAVLGYMSAVLLNKNNVKAAIIMENFEENFYNSKFPGLVLACYRSIFSGK